LEISQKFGKDLLENLFFFWKFWIFFWKIGKQLEHFGEPGFFCKEFWDLFGKQSWDPKLFKLWKAMLGSFSKNGTNIWNMDSFLFSWFDGQFPLRVASEDFNMAEPASARGKGYGHLGATYGALPKDMKWAPGSMGFHGKTVGKPWKTIGIPWENEDLCKHTKYYGKIHQFFMGKLTISMAIFYLANVSHYQRVFG
jgi:hypothetical protein